MKNTIIDILQRQSLRLSLCALAMTASTVSYAQDDMDAPVEEEATFKAPKRRVVNETNTLVSVSGVVVDHVTKQPVAGVRVQALADKRYTAMTDASGKFTIKLPDFETSLFVQAPRYMSQQVAIKSNDEKQQVKVSLLSDKFKSMYNNGTEYTAASTFNVKGGGILLDDEIQSNLGADIRSINRSGAADGGNAMFIRGLNSINANAQPLIIIDGVEMDMQRSRTILHQGRAFNMLANFSPEDIEKVQVLKNATALYGARGANGVILIDTKRGHSMATRIDANISAGVMLKPRLQTMMDASQYRNYATEMLGTIPELKKSENRDITFNFLNDDPNGYYYQMYHNNTDWQDEVYRTAITQNYNINVQGGDDIGMYNLSVGYLESQSSVKNTDFDRLNVRFNTDIKILWNLDTKFDMSFSRVNNQLFDDGFAPNLGVGTVTSPTSLAAIKSPLVTPYQYNKHVGGFTNLFSDYDMLFSPLSEKLYDNDYAYSLANPSAIISNAEGDNKNRVENTFFNVRISPKYTFNDNLSATVDFSYVLNRNSQRYYRPSEGVPPFLVEGLGTVYNLTSSLFAKETNVLAHAHVDWTNKFGAHDIAVVGGFRYNYFSYDGSEASTQFRTSRTDKNPYLTANPSEGYANIFGANDVWKNMQWYASADYAYRNRYFATVSLLAEANSRFGAVADGGVKMFGTQWAIFPSVQLGWVLTNEDWFPKNSFVDYLRVNAGFDMSGNDDISNYAARTAFTSVRYNYSAVGMQMTNIGNDEIKWENTTKWNLGFVANMLNNRFTIGADIYWHRTKDLLTLKTFDTPISGINQYWSNGGTLENKGVEFKISAKPVATKDLTVEVGASIGHYSNEIKSLVKSNFTDGVVNFTNGDYCNSVYGNNNILVSEGNPVGVFYGYQTAGVFSTDAEAKAAGNDTYLYIEDEAGNRQNFTAGDVHFIDQNRDGKIDENDKIVIGNPNPDFYGNIFATANYKRFTLDMGFNFSVGNDVYNYQRSILNAGSNFYNQQIAETGHWRYEGQAAALPKLAYGDPMGNNRFSDRWIEDGSYLRLKNVRLTYQIPVPESWTSWLQNLAVWGEAQNVFTITRYTGNDPEFSIGNSVMYQGIDCGNIAQSRAFVLGLKVNL
ncbi:MAG: SusC/RagA family TonB-linked outer membrane protein [Prevotellaceae bacterium]|nr:SusC/RagA family TonB-linked outer membrane protein [Prevotellaceae bacterium]MDO4931097.1 SusC/RagA family TonB-linked outer membrane protein [Prevotellaceae bacterium]